jgi:hypothetical protein
VRGARSLLLTLPIHRTAGIIVDDEVRGFLDQLPAQTRMVALVDACHSGTMMDLPYTWIPGGGRRIEKGIKAKTPPKAQIVCLSGSVDSGVSEAAVRVCITDACH